MSLAPDDPRTQPLVGGVPVSPVTGAGGPPVTPAPPGGGLDDAPWRAPDAEQAYPGAAGGPAAGRHHDPEGLSLGELFAEVSRDLSALVRQEMDLAKAEAMTSARLAGRGAGMLGGAAYAANLVLVFLSVALWWALGTQIGLGWSALVVAAVWAVVAAVLAVRGRTEIRRAPGMPETADSLKKIPHALQGHEEMNR